MCRNFIIFKRDLQRSLHENFSLENIGPGIELNSIPDKTWIPGGRSGRISGVRSGRISGVDSGRISGVDRISGVGRHGISLTKRIVDLVDSIVPRFRAGFSISFTVGFSFTFHNMDSTNRVGIIPVLK